MHVPTLFGNIKLGVGKVLYVLHFYFSCLYWSSINLICMYLKEKKRETFFHDQAPFLSNNDFEKVPHESRFIGSTGSRLPILFGNLNTCHYIKRKLMTFFIINFWKADWQRVVTTNCRVDMHNSVHGQYCLLINRAHTGLYKIKAIIIWCSKQNNCQIWSLLWKCINKNILKLVEYCPL